MATTSGSGVADTQMEEELPEFLRISPSDILIGELIGQGGFARVHKATWRGQECAAKIVQTADVLAIQREVAILSKLEHPNIIRCLGFSVDTDGDPRRCMILMELLDMDLRDLMNERLKNEKKKNASPFNKKEALDILCQIAAGMKYLHTRRVFHGDLKASNVLVSVGCEGTIDVKITDFGVSQMVKLDPAATSGAFVRKKHFRGVVGTRGYQAPEVSSSNAWFGHIGTVPNAAPELFEFPGYHEAFGGFYTAKADVYCFAITCYEIVSGQVPFESVKKPDIPALVLRGARPELPHGLDKRLVALIHTCWDRKPKKRPDFEAIGLSLQRISEEQGFERAWKWWARLLSRSRNERDHRIG